MERTLLYIVLFSLFDQFSYPTSSVIQTLLGPSVFRQVTSSCNGFSYSLVVAIVYVQNRGLCYDCACAAHMDKRWQHHNDPCLLLLKMEHLCIYNVTELTQAWI